VVGAGQLAGAVLLGLGGNGLGGKSLGPGDAGRHIFHGDNSADELIHAVRQL